MDSEFSILENIELAYFIKDILRLVDNIKPWDSTLEQCYYLNLKGGDYIYVTETEFMLLVKFLKYINYKVEIVDNKLKVERYENPTS